MEGWDFFLRYKELPESWGDSFLAGPKRKVTASVTACLRNTKDAHLPERALAWTCVEAGDFLPVAKTSFLVSSHIQIWEAFLSWWRKMDGCLLLQLQPLSRLDFASRHTPVCVCAGSVRSQACGVDPRSTKLYGPLHCWRISLGLDAQALGTCKGFSVHTPYPGTLVIVIMTYHLSSTG